MHKRSYLEMLRNTVDMLIRVYHANNKQAHLYVCVCVCVCVCEIIGTVDDRYLVLFY